MPEAMETNPVRRGCSLPYHKALEKINSCHIVKISVNTVVIMILGQSYRHLSFLCVCCCCLSVRHRLKLPLFEYVYIPHVSSDPNRPVRTKQPVLVGYLNIKRPQQLVTKKTGLALDDKDRDENTGKVKGDSKGGTTTGIENELLAGVGADQVLSEISGARGDNVTEYDNMLDEISRTGSVKLTDIKTGVYDKPTLLQTDLFLKAMGVKTDIISESYYSIERLHANMRDINRQQRNGG